RDQSAEHRAARLRVQQGAGRGVPVFLAQPAPDHRRRLDPAAVLAELPTGDRCRRNAGPQPSPGRAVSGYDRCRRRPRPPAQPPLPRSVTMPSDKKVRVAIVGLGFGAEFIPIYQAHPNAEIAAVCRRNKAELDKAADQYKIAKRYTSYAELLNDPDIDAIHIN